MPRSLSLTRREMRGRCASLLGTGLGTPLILPCSVLGTPDRPGANDRIGIAGIGIGRQGCGVLFGAARHPLGRPVAVADVNIKRAQAMAGRLKID